MAVFASGRGSNFEAIIRAVSSGFLKKIKLSLLVCDNPAARALGIARRAGIRTLVVRREDFSKRSEFEAEIIRHLERCGVELIVLAGFMRILSAEFVRRYRWRIMNIHPALLPAFKGAHAIREAFDSGVKLTGVTVHFVTEEMDSGPVILQEEVKVRDNDSAASLEKRIHRLEHKIYPLAIRLFLQGKLKIKGGKVRIAQSSGRSSTAR